MYGLTVEIGRCLDGVELIELPLVRPEVDAAGTLASGMLKLRSDESGPPTPLIFRYRTERVETARLEFTDLENPVVLAFLNAGDDESRRRFFEQFGLTIPGS